MTDIIANYIKASDNADDYADFLLEQIEQQVVEDVDELFTDAASRDAELWLEMDVNPELTVKDYDTVDNESRDIDWAIGLAGIAAAATTETFIRRREETIIKPLAYRMQALDSFSLTRAQLIEAGKRGTEIVEMAHYSRLQAKWMNELSFLKEMGNKELYTALGEYGALRPAEQVIIDSVDYVSRMTSHRPGSVQFKEATANLIDANSKRAMQGMNRRSVERIYSYREANSDLNTMMVWVGERGGRNCEYCLARFGQIATYNEWIEMGLPGTDVCKGGDRCRCHLANAD
ncbi:MAG: hypothetical protein GY847_28930 [Proteobacteria bacterium]|nr:hypothetical protein [Pseudomonadota bacterium]